MISTESPFITRVDMGLKMLMTITEGTEEFVSRSRHCYGHLIFQRFKNKCIYLTLDAVGYPDFFPPRSLF